MQRREDLMGIEYLIVGLVALGVGVYLLMALLRPDKF
jgi:K+-transporting ATPase KdpF subunit